MGRMATVTQIQYFLMTTYKPSSASTTLTVQPTPIPAPITGEPLPTDYWEHPIYGENSNWYTISSNWLGSGSPVLQQATYPASTLFHRR